MERKSMIHQVMGYKPKKKSKVSQGLVGKAVGSVGLGARSVGRPIPANQLGPRKSKVTVKRTGY